MAMCAAYSNSFHGPFIFDDESSIVENKSIRDLGSLEVLAPTPDAIGVTGRPFLNLTMAANYALGGLSPKGYHIVNFAIHVLVALVLFALVRRILLLPTLHAEFGAAATELAFAVALLWSVHPLQTESVTYVVQRAEALVGLFYVSTVYCFLRGATATRGSAWYAAAVGTCFLGMASKEVMVSAPVVALFLDRIFIAGSFRESLRKRRGWWLAFGATWVPLAIVHHMSRHRGGAAGFGLGMTAWEYARTQFGCVIHYLRLAFWPSPLIFDYGRIIVHEAVDIVPYAIGVFVIVAATTAGLVLRRRWAFLGVWFLAILAPSSSFIPLPGQTQAEHRMYLPLAAVVSLVVLSAYRAFVRLRPGPRWATAALVPAAAAALGWGTYQRNKDYQSELRIWDLTIRDCPQNDRAYQTRGAIHLTNGQLEAALQDYDQCITLNRHNADARIGRGHVHLRKGRHDEALMDFDSALRIKPDLADGYNGRGEVFGYRGQVEAAIREFNRAIELDPELALAHYNRASAYHGMGDLDAAIEGYDRVIALRPGYARAYNSRGLAHDNKGQVELAIADYEKAIGLQPDFAEAYSNLCSALDVKGWVDAAIEGCDKAIALRPDLAEAHTNRGNALQSKGQFEAAIQSYDRAIELKPSFAPPYQNRAMARYRTEAYDEAWADLRMVRKLGVAPVPSFVQELRKKSGRSE